MLSSQKRLFGNSGWNSGTDFPAFAKMEGVLPGFAGFLHTLPHRPRQAPLCPSGRAPVPAHRTAQPAPGPAVHPAVSQLPGDRQCPRPAAVVPPSPGSAAAGGGRAGGHYDPVLHRHGNRSLRAYPCHRRGQAGRAVRRAGNRPAGRVQSLSV